MSKFNLYILTVKSVFTLFIVITALGILSAQDDINVYRKEYLEIQINQSVENLFAVWEEERYAEQMYDYGNTYSKNTISLEDFADRMNRNRWTIVSADSKINDIELQELTQAFINVEITMAKKNNRSETYKINTSLAMIYEDSKDGKFLWRFNLLRLVAFPYPF